MLNCSSGRRSTYSLRANELVDESHDNAMLGQHHFHQQPALFGPTPFWLVLAAGFVRHLFMGWLGAFGQHAGQGGDDRRAGFGLAGVPGCCCVPGCCGVEGEEYGRGGRRLAPWLRRGPVQRYWSKGGGRARFSKISGDIV